MKHLKILITGAGIVAISCLLSSCAKTPPEKVATVNTDFSNKAIVQVVLATVNANRNYLYVDGKPVTGAPLASGNVFPSSGNGFNVDGGLKSFLIRDTMSTTTQVPYTFAENLGAAKHYTVFVCDTINAVNQKTVVDNIVVPTDTSARIRFANFIYNSAAMPAVDIYSFSKGANIFTNVATKDVTEFIAYSSKLTTDTLYIREAGTMNLLIKTSMTLLTPKRSYTFVYRGSHRGTRAATLYATY
jgi:hypothetical protein